MNHSLLLQGDQGLYVFDNSLAEGISEFGAMR
jgi:hypothetical protein